MKIKLIKFHLNVELIMENSHVKSIKNQLDNQGNDQIIYHDDDNHTPETEVDKYKFTDGEKLYYQELVDYLKNFNEEAEERFSKNGFKIELDSGIDSAVSFETLSSKTIHVVLPINKF
ncbi:hypothetical protein ACTA71_007008 [Dictyostelium dimigraforme]